MFSPTPSVLMCIFISLLTKETTSLAHPVRQPISSPEKQKSDYPESQYILDERNQKWRLCAGAAVINSSNQILVGQRRQSDDIWQCPQGGVDAEPTPESIDEAAIRELHEETGLVHRRHALLQEDAVLDECGIRYRTRGNGDWMAKQGFIGQELHWRVFRCIDGRGDTDPDTMCNVMGHEPEFRRVQWSDTCNVLHSIEHKKEDAYLALMTLLAYEKRNWEQTCHELDFAGRWIKDVSQCHNLVDWLVQARQIPFHMAQMLAQDVYEETWCRDNNHDCGWRVTPSNASTGMQEYRLHPNSHITHSRTAFLAEPDAHPMVALVTISKLSSGEEEVRRYRKGETLILRRTFWAKVLSDPVVCTEVFTPPSML